jgi:hypothetical protein
MSSLLESTTGLPFELVESDSDEEVCASGSGDFYYRTEDIILTPRTQREREFIDNFDNFRHRFIVAYNRASERTPLEIYKWNKKYFPQFANKLKKPSPRVQNRGLRKRSRADLQLQGLIKEFHRKFRVKEENIEDPYLEAFQQLPEPSVLNQVGEGQRFEPLLQKYIQTSLQCCCKYLIPRFQSQAVETVKDYSYLFRYNKETNTRNIEYSSVSTQTNNPHFVRTTYCPILMIQFAL